MNWFISLVIPAGLALGEIPFFKIKLGISGVLFSGLVFGDFGIRTEDLITSGISVKS
jgi:hypothetical protein